MMQQYLAIKAAHPDWKIGDVSKEDRRLIDAQVRASSGARRAKGTDVPARRLRYQRKGADL